MSKAAINGCLTNVRLRVRLTFLTMTAIGAFRPIKPERESTASLFPVNP